MTDYENLTDRELDAEVADKVMNEHAVYIHEDDIWIIEAGPDGALELPHYSTSIAAAWEIVTHLKYETGISMHTGRNYKKWCFKFGKIEGVADTLPRAICLSALRAVEGK